MRVQRKKLFVIFLLALSVSFPVTAAMGQLSGATGQVQQQAQAQSQLKEYSSPPEKYGVAFKYPANYSFDTYTQLDQSTRETTERLLGYQIIGILCPAALTLPSLGGGESCIESQSQTPLIEETEETPRNIVFMRVPDLDTKIRQELGGGGSTTATQNSLTPRDAFAWYIAARLDRDDPETEYIDESRGIKELVSTKNFTVPITQADTGQVVGQAPAILVEYTYNFNEAVGVMRLLPDVRAYHVFVLQEDNTLNFAEEARAEFMPTGQVPPLLQTVVNSFRLVVGSAETTAPSTPTPQQEEQQQQPLLQQQLQPPQRQQQQLQHQNQGASVSIVSGSSSLTTNAYQPNPVQVSVGDTVTWTNDDTQPHTVTAGENAQPSGEFDSSPNFNPLLAPKQTFEHTFTQAGEYPYYCVLHPNMVGTVSVS